MLFFKEAEYISEDRDLAALLNRGEASLISSLKQGAGEGAAPGAAIDFFEGLIGALLADSVQGSDKGDPIPPIRSRGDVRRFVEGSGLMEAAARLL
jgi:hypothetical protein